MRKWKKHMHHCIRNPPPWRRADPSGGYGLALPSSLPGVCVLHSASVNGHWKEDWKQPLLPDLKRCFLVLWRERTETPQFYIGPELWTWVQRFCTARRPHLGAGDLGSSRATHHWWRDCSCPGCRGPAEWHHRSAGSAPRTAVLCPAWSLWDLHGGYRLHPPWCLVPPSQPWGRRDMGIGTHERWVFLTTPSLNHSPSFLCQHSSLGFIDFLKYIFFCLMWGPQHPPL